MQAAVKKQGRHGGGVEKGEIVSRCLVERKILARDRDVRRARLKIFERACFGVQILHNAGSSEEMSAVSRQGFDSMVRVIRLKEETFERRTELLLASLNSLEWFWEEALGVITQRELGRIARRLAARTRSKHKFGRAFVHL